MVGVGLGEVRVWVRRRVGGSDRVRGSDRVTVVFTTRGSNFFLTLHFLAKKNFFLRFFTFNATIVIQNVGNTFLHN